MRPIIISCILLMTFANLRAQKSTTKELEKFNEIKVYDRMVVTLVKGSGNKLVITGEDQDEINISNKDGVLKIRMEFDNMMDGDELEVTLYFTEELRLLDANENAEIRSETAIASDVLDIRAQEGGEITLPIRCNTVIVKAVTGGEITLSGNSGFQEVTVNTGGQVYNGDLKTDRTDVTVNAGGVADIRASDYVDAKVRAGGGINIYGKPKEVDTKKVFGGKIEIKD